MKLSILLLTHNRPKLFERAINSIISQIDDDVEVIVNNDSNDITEINHKHVTYHYNKFDNLSKIYEFLLNEASGDYVYFAEDDDYIVNDFMQKIKGHLNNDLIIGNYNPTYNPWFKLGAMTYTSNEKMDEFLLQLSQHIFKRNLIMDFEFPDNSDVHNDILLVKHCMKFSKKVKYLNSILFYQTSEGGDNVSFPE